MSSFLFLFVAPVELYGWYKYTLYPLVAIGLGFVFAQLWNERVVYLSLFLPLLAMTLQESEILYEQTDRKIALVVFYAAAVIPLLIRLGPLRLRTGFAALLLLLFAIEAVWIAKVLGYLLD